MCRLSVFEIVFLTLQKVLQVNDFTMTVYNVIDNEITYWNDFVAQRPRPFKGRGR